DGLPGERRDLHPPPWPHRRTGINASRDRLPGGPIHAPADRLRSRTGPGYPLGRATRRFAERHAGRPRLGVEPAGGRAMSQLTEESAVRARDVLRSCVTSLGLRASAGERGYPEVWARDAMISLLGVCADGLQDLVPALRDSL